MPLTLRPTRLETSPVYAHLKDYTVFEGGTAIGRIYEQRQGAPLKEAIRLHGITKPWEQERLAARRLR